MTQSIAPRQLVASPSPPVPYRFGLLSAARIIEQADPHELNGIEYESVCHPQVDPYPVSLCPDGTLKQAKPTLTRDAASPFALYAADSCVLGRDEDDMRAWLRQRFLTGEQAAVERAVFSGSVGNDPNLQGSAVDITPPASDGSAGPGLPLDEAIGLLEQWMGIYYGGTGLLHAPRQLSTTMRSRTDATSNGGQATTFGGSTVVFGTGYTGAPPAAASNDTGDTVWLYATPPVTIRRTGLIEPAGWETGGFDKATNTGFLLEERQYVVSWPCHTAAVKTTAPRHPLVDPPSADARAATAHFEEIN